MDGRLFWKLSALVIVAACLRFSGIHAKTFWGDEVVCLNIATGHSWYPWLGEETELFYSAAYYRERVSLAPDYFSQRLVPLLRINDQIPPLYYVLLNLWMHVFGTSVAALRSLSLLASVASVPVIYALGRVTVSHRVGMYAAAIFAFAPFQVAFGLYNRPYALLCFFALASTLAAVHLSRGERKMRWMMLYGVTAILGAYTHYLFVWNLIFQVTLVAFCQRRNRPFLLRFGVMCLAVAGACLLWAPTFFDQMRWSRAVGSQSWFYWYSGSPSFADAVTSLGRNVLLLVTAGRVNGFCSLFARTDECQIDNTVTILLYLVPLMVLGLCGWRMLQHFRQGAAQSGATPDPWVLCLAWAGSVLAGPVLSDMLLNSHMVFSHRYFIAASGPIYLAIAMAFARTNHPYLRRGLVAGFLALLLAGSGFYLQGWSGTLMYEVPARDIAQRVDRRSTGADDLILVLDPGLNPTDFAISLKSNPDFARIDVPDRQPEALDIPVQLARITGGKKRSRVWYLDDHGPERRAHNAVLEWLRAHYVEVESTQFTNVTLFLFSPAGAR